MTRVLKTRWPYMIAAVVFVFVVISHHAYTENRAQDRLVQQRQIFAPQLWNLEAERATQTAEIIIQTETYDAIRVEHRNGQPFIEVEAHSEANILDRFLQTIGLVGTAWESVSLHHNGEVVGTLTASRVNRNIYLDFAVAVFLFLLAFAIQLISRNIGQQRDLTAANLQLETSRRKEAEVALLEREAQLLEVRRLETLGRLASGLAHDFNNVLTVITCSAEILLGSKNYAEPQRVLLKGIEDASFRAGRMTKQLLSFSRRQETESFAISLNEIVEDMHSMLTRLVGDNIKLVARLASNLSEIRANPSQIEQIVMNLVLNASDAIKNEGVITLETKDVADLAGGGENGDFLTTRVSLSVSDTGRGMDAETLAHAFEPFFSTKGNKGTGLGLSTVDGIVRASGGSTTVDSMPNKGTRINILFPSAEAATAIRPAESQKAAPVKGQGNRILIVEDQAMIRVVMLEGLKRRGFVVEQAADGNQGLEALISAVPPFDLVITDLNLPGKSGLELCRFVESQRPETQILCVSGHICREAEDSGISYPFLAKPFTIAQLVDRVGQILDQSSSQIRLLI